MRPNIVVLLCDQMRRHATSFAGEPNVRTPNIDRCAEQGVYFENACSTYPICVPFRFTLLTGDYAHTRMIPGIAWRMSPAERTIAHEMNDAGYETSYFGKWHLDGGGGRRRSYEAIYTNRTPIPRSHQGGFKYWRGFELRNGPFDTVYFEDDNPSPKHIEKYQTDGLVDLFEHYLSNDRDTQKPFFSIISVEPPHPPFIAPEAYIERMAGRQIAFRENVPVDKRNEKLTHNTTVYHAMIENLDDNVGRIIRMLEAGSLLDNTVFVFVSDHGELMGSHGLKDKQHPYEESIGIPLIFYSKNPELIPAGVRVSDPVATEDLFPTLCSLAGLNVGNKSKPGSDLKSLIRGEISHLEREGVLLEFVEETRPNAVYHEQTWRGFRTENYKYTVLGDALGGEPWQLFDLKKDPYEMENLVHDHESEPIARHLHGLLRTRMIETGDKYVLKPVFGHAGLNLWETENTVDEP